MRICCGIGLRTGAGPASLAGLFASLDLAPGAPVALPAFRAAHPVLDWLRAEGFQLHLIAPEALLGLRTPTQSPRQLAAYGTGSMAEACALALAGQDARIIRARILSGDRLASAALAQSDERPLS